ncbi:hypothetical protein [Ferrimonas pelagia]|uniref:Trypsin-like peptidase domain-containing protein n=1 Tax=Ferrimonas pelagia TaxID=1177826 RepID=A0ABP9FA89_9GAMM
MPNATLRRDPLSSSTQHYGIRSELITAPLLLNELDWSAIGDRQVIHLEIDVKTVRGLRMGLTLHAEPADLTVQFFATAQHRLIAQQPIAASSTHFSRLLTGSSITAELSLPSEHRIPDDLQLTSLSLIDTLTPMSTTTNRDSSELLNASCYAPSLNNAINSTVMLLIPNGYLCSGNLLAPTDQADPDKLYLYTAAHCISDRATARHTQVILDFSVPCDQEHRLDYATYLGQLGTEPLHSLSEGELVVTG